MHGGGFLKKITFLFACLNKIHYLCPIITKIPIAIIYESLKTSNMVTPEYLEEMVKELANMSVDSLIAEFNSQVGSDYWDSVIGVRHSLLIEALIAKVVDVSAVYDGISISFERKIKLNEDKTKVLFA